MDSPSEQVNLWREGQFWVIRDEARGVTTQGKSRSHAFLELIDAVDEEHSQKELVQLAVDVFLMSEEDKAVLRELMDDEPEETLAPWLE